VKVINEYGVSVITRVVTKQLHYMPITPRLKRLFLSKETMKQMRWHKEGKLIEKTLLLCHILQMARLAKLLTVLIQNLEGTQGELILVYR
jgi:hypothetical protein